MPSGPVLSDADKNDMRNRLQVICEHYLIVYGYKKTSIKKLCAKAEIAIGTFYALYPTKEDLFFETIKNIQERLSNQILETAQSNPTAQGFAQSIKKLFREYDSKPFLYNVNTPDFQAFLTKLPEESIEAIKFESIDFFRKVIHTANLKLKIAEDQAYGILSALLSTIAAKETLDATCDYYAVFDFMVDKLIPNIFEEAKKND